MSETAVRPRTLATVVALCVLSAGVFVASRLTTDDTDDRVVTFAAAWSGEPTDLAKITWFATSRGRPHTELVTKGHWEKLIVARKGDYVWIRVTPTVRTSTASTSIKESGSPAVHGSNYCQIPVLP